jgi:hypothetical protein
MRESVQRKVILFDLIYLVIIGGLAGFDQWALSTFWGISYMDWYLKNGAQIALITAFATLIWDLNQNTSLISANPRYYVSAYLHLIGMTFYSLGTQITGNRNAKVRPARLDSLMTSVITLILIVLILAWFVLVAPIQYFLILLIGAPARVVLASEIRVYARFEDEKLRYQELRKDDREGEKALKDNGWMNTSFSNKAVTFTNALIALTLAVMKYFLA